MNLENLIQQRTDLWRGNTRTESALPVVPTGYAVLDQHLGGGWPVGGLVEIFTNRAAGLALLMPGLARLSRKGGWITFIAPPRMPYAPGLARWGVDLSRVLLVRAAGGQEQLWALEQTLRSGVCEAALAWRLQPTMTELRRLQLAAEAGRASAFLFRPQRAANQPSPAALRLRMCPTKDGVELTILKRRGGWAGGRLRLQYP